jgi:hypothetical protein
MTAKKKLDRKFKAKWVKTLLSGRYKQGTGTLHRVTTPEEFCCLGVACKVARLPSRASGILRAYYDREVGPGADVVYALPTEFRRKIGLSAKYEDRLIRLNDSRGWSFKQIAAWIQEHL